jgi:acyl-coenzyme A thioesterase PaaI-like protein
LSFLLILSYTRIRLVLLKTLLRDHSFIPLSTARSHLDSLLHSSILKMSQPSELDSKSPFLRLPWLASQLQQPNTTIRVSPSREPKSSTEDSLFAEILKTDRTIQSCLSFYVAPNATAPLGQNAEGLEGQQNEQDTSIKEVTTLISMGSGMNGHPRILHGGITATLIDEAMGIFQAANNDFSASKAKKEGKTMIVGTFTAELTVRYLAPVRTPGCLEVKVRRTKTEGRKEWLKAEVRQWVGDGEEEGKGGKVVVVATGDALFITPRPAKI